MGAIEDYLNMEESTAPPSAAMAYLDQPDQKTGIEAIPGFVDSNTIKGLTMGAMGPLEVFGTLGTIKKNALMNVSNLIQGNSKRYSMNPLDIYGGATNEVLGAEKRIGLIDKPDQQQFQQEHPYAGAALQGIGSAALAPSPMNFARGAFGGVGTRIASDEFPDSKIAPIIGGLAGASGPDLITSGARALRGTIAPFTAANQAARADELINQSAYDPANLNVQFEPPLPGLQLTRGMITNDPGVQALERGIENATPNSQGAIHARVANNNGIISSTLGSLHSDGIVPNPTTAMADASIRLNDALDGAYTTARQRENAAWHGLNVPVQTAPLERSIDEFVDNLPKAQRHFVPGDVINIVRNDFEDIEPLNEITALRSTVRSAADGARIQGNLNQARVLNNLDGVILDHINNLSESEVGTAQVEQYNAARALSAENAQRFKTGPVSKLFSLDSTGADRVPASATGGLFFKPGAGGTEALQSLATAAGDSPEAIQAAKDYFVAQMMQKGVAGKAVDIRGQPIINPGNLRQYLGGNQHVLESGLFSPEEVDQINRAQHAAEIANRTVTSMPRGSPTYPLIQSGNFVRAPLGGFGTRVMGTVGGAIAGQMTGGPIGALLGASKGGDLLGRIYAGPNRNIHGLLYDRLVNPEIPPPAPFSIVPRQP